MAVENTLGRGRMPPMAIVGIGCLFPKAQNAEEFWALIKSGADAITEVPASHWRPEDYFSEDKKKADFSYAKRGGFLDPYPFDPLKFGVPPNALEATDTSQLLGMVAADQAVMDAGYGGTKQFDRERASVILGVTGALELVIPLGARLGHPKWRTAMIEAGLTPAQADDIVQRIAEQYVPWQENSFPGLLGNVVAGRISKYLNTGRTNCVVDAACASSMGALELAALELATGKTDVAITGGVDTFNDIFMYICFSKTPALSPTGNARPFDKHSDGTILGEGLGIVVLKRLADAERDGDRVYAVIRGIGSSSDGKGEAIYAPSTAGQVKALRDAYASAGVSPETIDLIEAHGTGTAKGDAVEISALCDVFKGADGRAPWCAVGSIKSQIGHTKAAAGAAGLIKATLALHHKVLPPTIKVEAPAESVADGTSPLYVNTTRRPWLPRAEHPRRAGISSFGFGGSNFHVVLEEYSARKTSPDWDGNIQIFAYSGADGAEIAKSLESISVDPAWGDLRDAAYASRQHFNATAPRRLVFVAARGKPGLAKLIAGIRAQLQKLPDAPWCLPDGASYGVGAPQGSIAIVFPGQGAQYPGMLRDIACTFPEMIDSLAAADAALGEDARGLRLSDFVFPHPAFDDAAREAQAAALRATSMAQPALGAVGLGAFRALTRFGVKAAAFAGHSYGELAALCAAGVFGEGDLARISRRRGELMETCDGDRGAMLAVRAGEAEINAIVGATHLNLTLANKNTPAQTVLSGPSEAIARAAEIFDARNLHTTPLNVAAAFHSPLVAGAAIPFGETLARVPFEAPAAPVYANSTAGVYPGDATAARELLANQLARPVEFVREIEAMYGAGVRTFVEAGPGAKLSAMIGQILAGKVHTAVSVDASSGGRDGLVDLARVLATLAAEGHPCDLRAWDGEHRPAEKEDRGRRMVVPICGANYRSEQSEPKAKRAIANGVGKTASTAGRGDVKCPVQDIHPTSDMPHPLMQSQSAPATPVVGDEPLAQLFRQTQTSLAALQQMQEQTARLHAQYLQNQDAATRAFQSLVEQQERLFAQMLPSSTGATTHATVPAPVAMPAHATVAHPTVTEGRGAEAPLAANDAVDLSEVLLEVVSEKTGYPRDMLEPYMALDADLGIDSIKRVEILSALQERVPELPAFAADELGGIQTLDDILKLVSEKGIPANALPAVRLTRQVAPLERTLLEVVSEKTGYPVEMIGLDMALDAELGIDSIKRVEILSALQERVAGLPTLDAEALSAIHTLRDVMTNFSTTTPAAPSAPRAAASLVEVEPLLIEVVAEKTGYPAEMIGLDMALDADLGIDSIKRVEILSALQEKMPELPALEAEALASLATLRDVVRVMSAQSAPAAPIRKPAETTLTRPAAGQSSALPRECLKRIPVPPVNERERQVTPGAQILVDGGSPEFREELEHAIVERGCTVTAYPANANGLVLVAPETPVPGWAWRALETTREFVRQRKGVTGLFIATVTRLDGAFGLRNAALMGEAEPGAVAGLAKTAAREWTEVRVRAMDLATDFASSRAACSALADELLADGPVETGIAPDGTTTIGLETRASSRVRKNSVAFGSDDVILITGGARGVTAAAAEACARAGCPKLALVGRSALLIAEPEWLRTARDERAIKRAIVENSAAKLSPHDVEMRYREVVSAREINETLKRIGAAGAETRYYTADVRDAAQVRKVVEQVRFELGQITGLMHGAGVIADKRIDDKTLEQFNAVYDTKVAGIQNVLAATAQDPLRFIALFSSSTARFGRVGQADYAMANEALNKIAQAEAARRSDCRVVSINWGPWDGGMVTPALRKVFATEGVGVISVEAGARFLVDELAAGGNDVEIVAIARAAANSTGATAPTAPSRSALSLELSAEQFPFLASHVIDGRAVLPVAMYVEWMAHAAVHANPGLRFVGLEDLRVLNGVVLDGDGPMSLEIAVSDAVGANGRKRVAIEMRGTGAGGRSVLHSTAIVLLDTSFGSAEPELAGRSLPAYSASRDDIYNHHKLFHGPLLQGIVTVDGCGEKGVSITASAAPPPDQWIREPLRRRWLADPLALDCAFQAMILWSLDQHETASLPVRLGAYEQFQTAFPKAGVRIEAKVTKATNFGATATIEFTNPADGTLVARIVDFECVMATSLNAAFQRNEIARRAHE